MNDKKSTFERMMEDPQWKSDFDKGYEDFLLSEFICEQMDLSGVSVRELAKKANVSPTTIQNMRSGNADNVRLKTLMSVIHELGFQLHPISYQKI